MSFPLEIGGRVLVDPPALAAAVTADAEAGGGTVVPGDPPAVWLMQLVSAGALSPELAVGLSAALLQSLIPAAIAEGARLAVATGDPRLAEITRLALAAKDVGLLFHPDPGAPTGGSVEDALLGAAVALSDLSDGSVRAELLERLRHAGLRDLELTVLATHGTAGEVGRWLPALLAEVPATSTESLLATFQGRPELAATLAQVRADA